MPKPFVSQSPITETGRRLVFAAAFPIIIVAASFVSSQGDSSMSVAILACGLLGAATWLQVRWLTLNGPTLALRAVLAAWILYDAFLAARLAVWCVGLLQGGPADDAASAIASITVPRPDLALFALLSPPIGALLFLRYQVGAGSHPWTLLKTAAIALAVGIGPLALFLLANLLSMPSPIHWFGFEELRTLGRTFALAVTIGALAGLLLVLVDQLLAAREATARRASL